MATLRASFIGATVVIVIGAISIIGQLRHLSTWVDMDNVVGGTTAILGAVACRLSKQRRLGLGPGNFRILELVLLALVLLAPIIQILMGIDFVTRPWSNLIIPIWTLAAYQYIQLRNTDAGPSIKS